MYNPTPAQRVSIKFIVPPQKYTGNNPLENVAVDYYGFGESYDGVSATDIEKAKDYFIQLNERFENNAKLNPCKYKITQINFKSSNTPGRIGSIVTPGFSLLNDGLYMYAQVIWGPNITGNYVYVGKDTTQKACKENILLKGLLAIFTYKSIFSKFFTVASKQYELKFPEEKTPKASPLKVPAKNLPENPGDTTTSKITHNGILYAVTVTALSVVTK